MSVHWGGTKQSTVRHTQPFCRCPDGKHCSDATWRKPPKKAVVHKHLAARVAAWEALGTGKGQQSASFRRKPGSTKK